MAFINVALSVAVVLITTVCVIESTTAVGYFSTPSVAARKSSESDEFGNSDAELQKTKCTVEIDLNVKFDTTLNVENCCKDIVKSFRNTWTLVLYHVTDYLRVLKKLNCRQFSEECANRTYDFTEFTSLTYDRFCDSQTFFQKCGDTVAKTLRQNDNKSVNSRSARLEQKENIIQRNPFSEVEATALRNLSLNIDDLLDPCIQASLVNTEDNIPGEYYEMKEIQMPFCGFVWCGFPGYAFNKYEISEWTCTPNRCRGNIYALMVTCGILAVISISVNGLSLVIFQKNRRLRDSQGIYKISLAITDLIIGLVVFPCSIETIRRMYMPGTELLHPIDNGKYYLQIYSFTEPYHNFVGFFTVLTNFVATFTLMTASLDRFMVVFRPLRYNLYSAKGWAIKLSVAVWVVGMLLSILPIIIPNMRYGMIAGFLESFSGDGEIIFLSILFVIPMVIVVITHIATIAYSKRNARARPKPVSNGNLVKDFKIENRLARTLGIMVGAFLLCVLPLGVLIISHLFVAEINAYRPKIFNADTASLFTSLEYIFCVIFLSNSIWNFVIYNARSAEFREATRKYFIRLKIKSGIVCSNSKNNDQRKTSAALSSTQSPNTASTALNI